MYRSFIQDYASLHGDNNGNGDHGYCQIYNMIFVIRCKTFNVNTFCPSSSQ